MNKFFTLFFTLIIGCGFSYAQCTTENSLGCECEDPNDTSCDLLLILLLRGSGALDSQEYPRVGFTKWRNKLC